MSRGTLTMEDGELKIDLADLVQALTKDQKRELWKQAAFEDACSSIFADLITEDITEDGWWMGGSICGPLHRARVKILEKLDKVERLVVKELLRFTKQSAENEKRYHDWAWAQYHWIVKERLRGAPEIPELVLSESVTEKDVDAALSKQQMKIEP